MGIKIGNFICIYRDPGTETGLSALEGTEVERVEDLPEHLVEVHVFSDNTYATTFLEGIQLVGIGNSMAVTRQFGTTHTNQVVLVARFDEPRLDGATPLECLKVVHHERDFAPDATARKEWMDNHQREQEAFWNRNADFAQAEGEPVAMALRTAGMEAKVEAYAGETSVRAHRKVRGAWGPRAVDAFTVTIPHGKGDATVTVKSYELARGTIDLEARYREIAAAHGVAYGPEGNGDHDLQIRSRRGADACAAAVAALEACLEECKGEKRAAYEREFRSGMKVTAARRRLFAAGREGGLRLFVNRNNQKARAGGEEIGATEIADLKRMGWLEDGPDRTLLVTDAALQAAGLSRGSEDDYESAAPRMR